MFYLAQRASIVSVIMGFLHVFPILLHCRKSIKFQPRGSAYQRNSFQTFFKFFLKLLSKLRLLNEVVIYFSELNSIKWLNAVIVFSSNLQEMFSD